MRFALHGRPYDLLVVVTASCMAPILLVILNDGPVRIALGLLFLIFLPGYAFMAALFPGKRDIDWTMRVVLSIGLSIAMIPLIGLILNYSPFGIHLESIVFTMLLVILGISVFAYRRRMRLPEEERLSISINIPTSAWKEYTAIEKALAIILAGSVVLAAGVLAYVLTEPRDREEFTEFYILDKNGKAEDYPTILNPGQIAAIIIGIVNHESSAVNYTVRVVLTTLQIVYNNSSGKNETIEVDNSTLVTINAFMENEAKWEHPFEFSIAAIGDFKLKLLLFVGSDQGEPYHSLQLWMEVV